jgi:plasmid maintenance system antidote protein VapI
MIDEETLDELERDYCGEELRKAIRKDLRAIMGELVSLARDGLKQKRLAQPLPPEIIDGPWRRHVLPEWSMPPGKTIEYLLAQAGVVDREDGIEVLSELLEISPQDAARLLIGDLELDEEIAVKLSRRFHVLSGYWLDREFKYQVYKDLCRLRGIEDDFKTAAGELSVPIPEPGSDMARLLHAVIRLRKYRVPELEHEVRSQAAALQMVRQAAAIALVGVENARNAIDRSLYAASRALLSDPLMRLGFIIDTFPNGQSAPLPTVSLQEDTSMVVVDLSHAVPPEIGQIRHVPDRLSKKCSRSLENLQSAASRVNGGFETMSFLTLVKDQIWVFEVFMTRQCTMQDHVLGSLFVPSDSTMDLNNGVMSAQPILRGLSRIDGVYAIAFVSHVGHVDIYSRYGVTIDSDEQAAYRELVDAYEQEKKARSDEGT